MDTINDNIIKLTYLNGTGYIFNADDYQKIRMEYRIIGGLVGVFNVHGWTPGLNSLPAELNQYETQLLLEKKYAILLNKNGSLTEPPDLEKIKEYKDLLEKMIEEQIVTLRNGKIQKSKNNITKILAGKINKLIQSGIPRQNIKITESDILEEILKNFEFKRENALLEIPREHNWKHRGVITRLPIDNSIRYRVFKDIWEKGKYITSGEAFGADFIVYPGDPFMFHASHIIIVLDDPTINPLDIISKCRLSVIVNKHCVFAYLNDKNELSYQTVEWENYKENESKTNK